MESMQEAFGINTERAFESLVRWREIWRMPDSGSGGKKTGDKLSWILWQKRQSQRKQNIYKASAS